MEKVCFCSSSKCTYVTSAIFDDIPSSNDCILNSADFQSTFKQRGLRLATLLCTKFRFYCRAAFLFILCAILLCLPFYKSKYNKSVHVHCSVTLFRIRQTNIFLFFSLSIAICYSLVENFKQ